MHIHMYSTCTCTFVHTKINLVSYFSICCSLCVARNAWRDRCTVTIYTTHYYTQQKVSPYAGNTYIINLCILYIGMYVHVRTYVCT